MRRIFVGVVWALAACATVMAQAGGGAKLTVEELIGKHLASLGTPEARAKAVACGVDGAAQFQVTLGGAGQISGSVKLGS